MYPAKYQGGELEKVLVLRVLRRVATERWVWLTRSSVCRV